MLFGRIAVRSMILAATLLILGCDRDDVATVEVGTMVRGATTEASKLIFICDDGESYETSSRSYGGGWARFSLTLPREAVCHLWVKPSDSGMIRVTFRDRSGERSPLIYLKSSRIDLGKIRTLIPDDRAESTVNDDVLLVALEPGGSRQRVGTSLTFLEKR
ncbi:hypothetical protein [Nitratifractor sp.]